MAGSALAALGAKAAGPALAALLAAAHPHQVIRLPAGHYHGHFVLAVPGVSLVGSPGAVLDGDGSGSVLTVKAPDCAVSGLSLCGSGRDILADDAAVRVEGTRGVRLDRLSVANCLDGLYVLKSDRVHISHCHLTGIGGRGIDDNGDGCHLFHSGSVNLHDCRVEGFRDGLYLEFSPEARIERSTFSGNHRYGLHVMLTSGTRFSRCAFTDNAVGSVLMYSKHIVVEHNLFARQKGAIGQAMLFKENDDSVIRDNELVGNTTGFFIDGSERNLFTGNRLVANGWGILLFASSSQNRFVGNAFLANDFEVAVDMAAASNRFTGNFWSGRVGAGTDTPYNPVRPFAFLAIQRPDLLAFGSTPAARALDAAFQIVPGLIGMAVQDEHPLATPPRVASGIAQEGCP